MNKILQAFGNLSIRAKLYSGFGLILLITALIAILGFQTLSTFNVEYTKLGTIRDLSEAMSDTRIAEKNFLIREDSAYTQEAIALVENIRDTAAHLVANANTSREAEVMAGIQGNAETYLENFNAFTTSFEDSQAAEAEMTEAARAAQAAMIETEDRLEELIEAAFDGDSDTDTSTLFSQYQRAGALTLAITDTRQDEKNFIDDQEAESAQKVIASLKQIESQGETLVSELDEGGGRNTMNRALERVYEYETSFNRLIDNVAAETELEDTMREEARILAASVDDWLGEMDVYLSSLQSRANAILIGATLVALLLGLAIAYGIVRLIVSPVNQLVEVFSGLADGDLTQDINSDRKDEMGQLMESTHRMIESLRALIGRLSEGITQLASASEEMSTVAKENSRLINDQKSETDQVATAMDEMTATVREVARNAEEASTATTDCQHQTESGGEKVHHTIQQTTKLADEVQEAASAISELKNDADQIGTVLDVINGIAEQTNLLALNAAIEAARAGEAGRGFSVVADEVRSLSLRTQQSTNQIETLINRLQSRSESTMETMKRGAEVAEASKAPAEEARTAFEAITKAVVKLQEMNEQIASSVTQQSSVAEEINRSVLNISNAAEQTATGSEQTLQANEELSQLGQELQDMASKFRVA